MIHLLLGFGVVFVTSCFLLYTMMLQMNMSFLLVLFRIQEIPISSCKGMCISWISCNTVYIFGREMRLEHLWDDVRSIFVCALYSRMEFLVCKITDTKHIILWKLHLWRNGTLAEVGIPGYHYLSIYFVTMYILKYFHIMIIRNQSGYAVVVKETLDSIGDVNWTLARLSLGTVVIVALIVSLDTRTLGKVYVELTFPCQNNTNILLSIESTSFHKCSNLICPGNDKNIRREKITEKYINFYSDDFQVFTLYTSNRHSGMVYMYHLYL